MREYKTRDGRPAFVERWHKGARYPAEGKVWDMDVWHFATWDENGMANGFHEASDDLMDFDAEIWKPAGERKVNVIMRHLRAFLWTPCAERMPTEDDGNSYGDVEWWSKQEGDIWQAGWDKPGSGTHWRKWITPESSECVDAVEFLNVKGMVPGSAVSDSESANPADR